MLADTQTEKSAIDNNLYRTEPTTNNKLSYRRGTTRRDVTVKTVLNVAQMFVQLHLISPVLGE